jgi:putative transposase
MAEHCREEGVAIWGYCLMPNHVHLVSESKDGLRRAVGEAHRRYTSRINRREQWTGYLWQGRFASFVLDEPYLLAAIRYVERNPVRARLADWPWSSARAHLAGRDDSLTEVAPLLSMIPNWQAFLDSALSEDELHSLRNHARTGRPLGGEAFLDRLEAQLDRNLRPKPPGRKPKFPKPPN